MMPYSHRCGRSWWIYAPTKIGGLVVDNGSTNAAKVKAFRMHRTFYGPRLAGHVMPRERSVDIDEQSDYDLACWYANKLGYR